MNRLPSHLAACLVLATSIAFADDNSTVIPRDNGTPAATPLPVAVAPTDSNLYYMGRFDMANGAGPTCAWSGSAVGIRFHGTAINADLTLGPNNRFEVVVDGTPTKVLVGLPGKTLYNLASGLSDADHTVLLFKNTEANMGTSSIGGFQLSQGGKVLPYPAPKHRIEVIGDSISCGYGNEAPNQTEHFKPDTENAYRSYGAVTARAFDADYTCIAWSGRKLWPDNTIVSLYDRILPKQPEPLWKFDGPKPEVVLINLCTNDFGRGDPEEEGWVKAYHDFIAQVRKNYPDSIIYLAIGSMMNDGMVRHPLTTARGYIRRVVDESNKAGDAKVHFLEFAVQNPAVNGVGADWHPSVKTDQVMAQTFIDAIQKDLGWTPVTRTP